MRIFFFNKIEYIEYLYGIVFDFLPIMFISCDSVNPNAKTSIKNNTLKYETD